MMLSKLTRLTGGVLFFALLSLPAQAAPNVEMQTSAGTLIIELDAEKAPKTVQNFLSYAKDGFYNGTIFHRVIDGFMIQGGGFTQNMSEKPTAPPVENEAKNGLKNQRGTLSMARRSDPHSATAQFFINHKNNTSLDSPSPDGWGYTVFGRVVKGMDVVDKIAKVPTGNRPPHRNVPVEPVTILSVKVISDKK